MNIFVLDENPIRAAEMMDCVRVPKMIVESAQMMASALRRHGAVDSQMPLTKSGTPYKGGYKHHPCTVWAGDSWHNFDWLANHAIGLLGEYYMRFGKEHACGNAIGQMNGMSWRLPNGRLTPFAQAMPDEYKDRIHTRNTQQTGGGLTALAFFYFEIPLSANDDSPQ